MKAVHDLQSASSGRRAAANRRFGIMAAGRICLRLFVRYCASVRAEGKQLSFSFYHQLLIINLASAARRKEHDCATTPSPNRWRSFYNDTTQTTIR